MAANLFQGMDFEISADNVTYTAVGCVTGYSLDGGGRSEIDTTCNTSTSKEFAFGLKDNGTLSLDINYEPTGAGLALAEASYASDTAYYFRITYTDVGGTTKTFQGFVMNLSDNGALDDKISGTIEIRVSGDITKA